MIIYVLETLEKVLPEKIYEELISFMRGQTLMVTEDGLSGIYDWDFSSWRRHYENSLWGGLVPKLSDFEEEIRSARREVRV